MDIMFQTSISYKFSIKDTKTYHLKVPTIGEYMYLDLHWITQSLFTLVIWVCDVLFCSTTCFPPAYLVPSNKNGAIMRDNQ